MAEVKGNNSASITVSAGYTLTVSSRSAFSSGLVRRISNFPGNQIQNIPANSTKMFGPFPTDREYSIEAIGSGGELHYDLTKSPYDNAAEVGNVEGFTGSFPLKNEDMGKVFRCDDSANVTITVPNSLVQGFNCGFIMYSTGNIVLAFDAGATNKSAKTTISVSLGRGSLLVAKQAATLDAAEVVVGGDFN